MKKGLKLIALILIAFISAKYVKADSIVYPSLYNKQYYDNFINVEELQEIMTEYEEYREIYPFYIISLDWDIENIFKIYGVKNQEQIYSINESIYVNGEIVQIYNSSGTVTSEEIQMGETNYVFNSTDINNKIVVDYYDSNIAIITDWAEFNYEEVKISDFYTSDNIVIKNGETYPKLKDLISYNSWSDYENENIEGYTEVNLDNFEYVLLSLKNYNQTNAFQTNLQVKGQIGITPIYNYGQTSKDSVTGVKVQDICNISYENYTAMQFYILQTDLQNNVIYAVKECSQGSSFKFDNNIFDITYVTAENKDNPTITIGGKTYDVIPYEDLPSTATKNEEEGYIPGESENAITGNTVGLNAIIKNVQQKMSEIWSTFTYFTSFVGQIFSSMPSEVQTVLLSAFTIAIVLGLIKIFIN